MVTEKEWVEILLPKLDKALQAATFEGIDVGVVSCQSLPYRCEIFGYGKGGDPLEPETSKYETDLLIIDKHTDGHWIPRVVIECKVGQVTTHDALTYSAKAATHKQVHPYLRYGILIGGYGGTLPGRLVRHGAYFDLMMVWNDDNPSQGEWSELIRVLTDEVQASRDLQAFISKKSGKKPIRMLHRPLRFRQC